MEQLKINFYKIMKETKITYLNNRMLIEEKHSIHDLLYSNILYIGYQDYYTFIFTDKDKEILICQSLKKLLANLPSDLFAMCNRKTIVNLSHVFLIDNNGQYFLQLNDNNIRINISRRNVKEVMERFLFLKKIVENGK
jgi:DNA-binding LytR/AlgR family response regulator